MHQPNGRDRSPFNDTTTSSDFPSRSEIKVLQNNPEIVIRKADWLDGNVDEQVKKVARYRQLVNGLESKGIHTAMLAPLIAEDPSGASVVYIVTKKIIGTNMLELAEDDKGDALDTLRSIASYYKEVIHSGGEYVDELRLEQLVYGHPPGEVEDNVYLVDLDPSVGTYNAANPSFEEREDMLTNLELLELDGKFISNDEVLMSTLQDMKNSVIIL